MQCTSAVACKVFFECPVRFHGPGACVLGSSAVLLCTNAKFNSGQLTAEP